MIKLGIILGYRINGNILKIVINNTHSSKQIKLLSKPSMKINIKYKHILKIKNINTGSAYVLLTNKGILTLHEAINKKTGGILLFKFF